MTYKDPETVILYLIQNPDSVS